MNEDYLEKIIEQKKEELKNLVDAKNSIKSDDIYKASIELDQLVVELMKRKKLKKG